MKIQKYKRSKTDDGLNDYIEALENHILEFNVDNVVKLVLSINKVAGIIVQDVDNIVEGREEFLTILVDDSKTFEKIQKIVEKIDSWKKVIDIAKAYIPEIEEVEQLADKLQLKGTYSFEEVQKKLKGGK